MNFILSVHDNIVCISKIHILLIFFTFLIENCSGKTNAVPRLAGDKKETGSIKIIFMRQSPAKLSMFRRGTHRTLCMQRLIQLKFGSRINAGWSATILGGSVFRGLNISYQPVISNFWWFLTSKKWSWLFTVHHFCLFSLIKLLISSVKTRNFFWE